MKYLSVEFKEVSVKDRIDPSIGFFKSLVRATPLKNKLKK